MVSDADEGGSKCLDTEQQRYVKACDSLQINRCQKVLVELPGTKCNTNRSVVRYCRSKCHELSIPIKHVFAKLYSRKKMQNFWS